MAPRALLLIFLAIFLTTLIRADDTTPFGFIKNLRGCHKGEPNVTDLHKLKTYLKRFGYSISTDHSDDDEFDNSLESAVKTYQTNYNLAPTGTLDKETVAQMAIPRCGNPDIVSGSTRMKSGHGGPNSGGPSLFHMVSHFSFFPGRPRWPSVRTQLRYAFLPGFPVAYIAPVARAFTQWDVATRFSFVQVADPRMSDITIGFASGNHGDGSPFDGRGGVLAHAFAPTAGMFHYDADEPWSVNPMPSAFHVETVALHEIGHLLGLGHSSVSGAIMWPSIAPGAVKGLHPDDIQGIVTLYT